MQSLRNTRVLITGAGLRIGRQLALSFADAGASVVIHYHRSEKEAHSLFEQLNTTGEGHELICADLADQDALRGLIPRLIGKGLGLNCLVNNASFYRRCALMEVDRKRILNDYEINFVAPFLLMRDFAYYCEEGSIINILDQRVRTVDPCASTYGFAKKSLRDATEAAAVEWAPRIRVNAVAPGLVLPPRGVPSAKMERLMANVPMGRTSPPEEVADACLFLAAAETITGQILYVDGGMHLVNPVEPELQSADYSSVDSDE